MIEVRNLTSAGSDLGSLGLDGLAALLELGNSLKTHVASTPAADNGVVELLHKVSLELCALDVILGVVGGQSNNGTVLLVHKSSKTSLTLDNAKGDVHLTAKSGQPDNKLNRVNIMGDNNHGGLLLLNKSGDVLKSVLEHSRGGTGSGVLTLGSGGGSSLEALDLSLLSLRLVLHKKLEKLGSLVLVKSSGELLDSRGDLKALKKDLLLSLKTDIARPSHEARKITVLGADVSSHSHVLGSGGEQRVRHGDLLGLHLLHGLGLRITGRHFRG